MPRDGSGNFALAEPAFVNGTIIDADVMNAVLSDIAAGLTDSLADDGQTIPTANLPMGGFKHTNVGAATAATNYARADQVVGSSLSYGPDSGTATAYAIAPVIPITAYAVGQQFSFGAANANSGTAPTLAVSGLTPGTIVNPDGTALAIGDIAVNAVTVVEVAALTTGTPTFHLVSMSAGLVRKGGAQTIAGAKTFSATVAMSGAAINEAVRVDVASATTTDIGAAASNYVRITGTTTITGLGTITSARRNVVFGGVLILTHNATSLILPTGANITTAAGDCAEFESEGSGNWRCTDYQRASGVAVLTGQVVTTQPGTSSSGTTVLPYDDTIPQNGADGDEVMTLAITPKSATSKLIIDVVIFADASATCMISAALFQDSVANALSAVSQLHSTAGTGQSLSLVYSMVSGTTSATTFKVRIGPSISATVYFNGNSSGRLFGGVAASSITIREMP